MIELTTDSVISVLDELVQEAGEDFVYRGVCKYVKNDEPSCLVGKVLAKAGVPLERLEAADRAEWGGGQSADVLLNNLRAEGVVNFEGDDVAVLLQAAQSRQDNRNTWAKAVSLAKAKVGK